MAKIEGTPCLNCLQVNDPADMLDVVIDHHANTNPWVFRICRRCGIAVIRAAAKTELIGLEEVFPGVDLSAGNSRDSAPIAPAPEAPGVVVSGDLAGDQGHGEHRREPQLPAGGAGDAGPKE